MLRADSGVVKPGGDAVRELNLAILVLQEERASALQYAEFAALESSGVFAVYDTLATRLDTAHRHRLVVEKRVKQADRVRAAADAGDEVIRQSFFLLENLTACLVADHALEVAHHHGVRVRAVGGAENVVRAPDVRHPVAHCLVDRLLERLLTSFNRHDFRTEHAHAKDVQRLPLAID